MLENLTWVELCGNFYRFLFHLYFHNFDNSEEIYLFQSLKIQKRNRKKDRVVKCNEKEEQKKKKGKMTHIRREIL